MEVIDHKFRIAFLCICFCLSYADRNSPYYRLGEYVYLLGDSTTGMFTRLFTEIDGDIVLQNIIEYNQLLQNLTQDMKHTNKGEVKEVCKVIMQKGEPKFLTTVDFEALKTDVLWRYAYLDKVREIMLQTRFLWKDFIKCAQANLNNTNG